MSKTTFYKIDEVREYTKDRLEEALDYDPNYLDENDVHDIHHQLFNEDYYIIGTWKAEQWLGSKAFEVIGIIKEYEEDQFGEVYTVLSNPEMVVNMYVYIVGESILYDMASQNDGTSDNLNKDSLKVLEEV